MNILKLNDDFAINMDYVLSMCVVGENNRYSIMFKTNIVNNDLFDYGYETSPIYDSYEKASEVLDHICDEFGYKRTGEVILIGKEKSKW